MALSALAISAGLSAASGIIGAIGSSKARKAQARAARRQARLKSIQAQKLIDNNRLNLLGMSIEGQQLQSQQTVSYAKSGVDIGSGSALEVLADTQAQVFANQYLSSEEAKFNAQQIRIEGQVLNSQAKSLRRQGTFEAVGQLFGAGADIAKGIK